MKMSKDGIELLTKLEGLKTKAYRDSVGVWTIGYGHTAMAGPPKPMQGMVITAEEAKAILARDLGQYEAAVNAACGPALNQNQFDAMTSLCFNIGQGAFRGSSVVRRWNAGDVRGAADAFLMWNKAKGKVLKGLDNRRKQERAYFLLPPKASQTVPQAVPPAPAPAQPPVPPSPPAATPAKPAAPKLTLGRVMAAVVALILGAAAYFFKTGG